MKIFMFRTPKPKRFNFKPRYYDPDKEEIEKRKYDLGITDSDDPEIRLRAEMKKKWRNEARTSRRKSDLQRTLFFIVIIALLVYIIFFT